MCCRSGLPGVYPARKLRFLAAYCRGEAYATKEIFLSNFVRLYQALDQAGQTVKLDIYQGMPHVFVPTLPKSAESQAAIAKVRNWVSEHLLDD